MTTGGKEKAARTSGGEKSGASATWDQLALRHPTGVLRLGPSF